MSDIIERARYSADMCEFDGPLLRELTDEIERLRADLATIKEELRGESLLAEDRKAEIGRLRAELDKAHRLCGQFIGWQRDLYIANAKLAQQVERLQQRIGVQSGLNDRSPQDDPEYPSPVLPRDEA